jgi:hypothetical protein
MSASVEPAAIRAIRLKVDRAHDQLERMRLDVDRYIDRSPSPYGLVQESDAVGEEHCFRLRITDPLPIEWAVSLGEVIHNLRSALDQCVYQLYGARKGTFRNGTSFPICDSPERFRAFGRDDIRGIGDGVKSFLKDLQPYPNRQTPVSELLARLHSQDEPVTGVWPRLGADIPTPQDLAALLDKSPFI